MLCVLFIYYYAAGLTIEHLLFSKKGMQLKLNGITILICTALEIKVNCLFV